MIGCLRTHVLKQQIIAQYFESENELKFYNLKARNGNCLFNTISTAFSDNKELVTDIWLKTAIEILLNSDFYKACDDFDQLKKSGRFRSFMC